MARPWQQQRAYLTLVVINRDNGPGFYDYNQYRWSEQLRYRAKNWELSGQGALARYDFDQRWLSPVDPSKRRRTAILLSARAERKLAESWKVYAQYDHEQSLANLAADEYAANSGLLGIEFTF